jgi:hypothetical protein
MVFIVSFTVFLFNAFPPQNVFTGLATGIVGGILGIFFNERFWK